MRMHETVNSGNVYRRDHLGVIHISGKMILKSVLMEIICEGGNWIQPTEDRVKWWGLLNMIMKLLIL
jgi:hypothetical protein